jgi:hypothetical protein
MSNENLQHYRASGARNQLWHLARITWAELEILWCLSNEAIRHPCFARPLFSPRSKHPRRRSWCAARRLKHNVDVDVRECPGPPKLLQISDEHVLFPSHSWLKEDKLRITTFRNRRKFTSCLFQLAFGLMFDQHVQLLTRKRWGLDVAVSMCFTSSAFWSPMILTTAHHGGSRSQSLDSFHAHAMLEHSARHCHYPASEIIIDVRRTKIIWNVESSL